MRAALAKKLATTYGMNQTDIANKLGVAQAAVNKYLKGKYSKKIKIVEKKIRESGLEEKTAKAISSLNKKGSLKLVNKLASDKKLMAIAEKLLS